MTDSAIADSNQNDPYRKRIIHKDPAPSPEVEVKHQNNETVPLDEERDPITTGEEEAAKESIKDEIQHTEKLNQLVENAGTVLFRIKTTFPFVFFPHEIIITLSDVSVVFGKFLTSREIRTVSISKIAEVIVTTGFLFAQLKIIDTEYSQLTIQVDYLDRNEAMKAKRLIQGLLFATKEGVDLTKVKDDDMISKIEELGRVQGEKLDQR